MDHAAMINWLMEEGRAHAAREAELQAWFEARRAAGIAPTWEDLAVLVEHQRRTLDHQSNFCFGMISFLEQIEEARLDAAQSVRAELEGKLSELLRAQVRSAVRRHLTNHSPVRRAGAWLRRAGELLSGERPPR